MNYKIKAILDLQIEDNSKLPKIHIDSHHKEKKVNNSKERYPKDREVTKTITIK